MKPTCSANIAPPIAGEHGGDAEGEDLEVGDAVAGEADAVLLLAHRHQDAAELQWRMNCAMTDAGEQQHDLDEVAG